MILLPLTREGDLGQAVRLYSAAGWDRSVPLTVGTPYRR